jgi:hypothetical protein
MHPTALHHIRRLDRGDLATLLTAIDGAKASLRRDADGDPWIVGERGYIRVCNGWFSIAVECGTARRWEAVKRLLPSFTVVSWQHEAGGTLQITRMPYEAEATRAAGGDRFTQGRPSSRRFAQGTTENRDGAP